MKAEDYLDYDEATMDIGPMVYSGIDNVKKSISRIRQSAMEFLDDTNYIGTGSGTPFGEMAKTLWHIPNSEKVTHHIASDAKRRINDFDTKMMGSKIGREYEALKPVVNVVQSAVDFLDGMPIGIVDVYASGVGKILGKKVSREAVSETLKTNRGGSNIKVAYPKRVGYQGTGNEIIGGHNNRMIGTGEGGAAYGYGHYVTGDKHAVANHYSELVTKRLNAQHGPITVKNEKSTLETYIKPKVKVDGEHVPDGMLPSEIRDRIYEYGSIDDLIHFEKKVALPSFYRGFLEADKYIEVGYETKKDYIRHIRNKVSEIKYAIKWLEKNKGRIQIVRDEKYKKRIYTVEIPELDEMLIWDKRINEHDPKVVKKLLGSGFSNEINAPLSEVTGQDIYNTLVENFGSKQKASEFLLSIGIKGHDYPVGQLTGFKHSNYRNQVVYDGKDIKIKAEEFLDE